VKISSELASWVFLLQLSCSLRLCGDYDARYCAHSAAANTQENPANDEKNPDEPSRWVLIIVSGPIRGDLFIPLFFGHAFWHYVSRGESARRSESPNKPRNIGSYHWALHWTAKAVTHHCKSQILWAPELYVHQYPCDRAKTVVSEAPDKPNSEIVMNIIELCRVCIYSCLLWCKHFLSQLDWTCFSLHTVPPLIVRVAESIDAHVDH